MINNQLTIITSHYRDIKGLLLTWDSIKNQTYKKWKWIIVDSYTHNFKSLLPKDLVSNDSINIYQLDSSIYDAMNLGILLTKTDFYHFLNCNSTYSSETILEEIFFILKRDITSKNFLHTFEMTITNKNINYIQSPINFKYPYTSGHESTIFPLIKKDKILIRSYLGVVADMVFMFENSLKFKIKSYKMRFVNYPRGGYSDSSKLTKNKIRGYLSFFMILFLRGKLVQATITIYRIIGEINVLISNRIKN